MNDDGHFDQAVADSYDTGLGDMSSPEAVDPVVDFIVERCHGGAALEFGVGTGRIALPLAERGIVVAGIDISNAMVEKMRAKVGGDAIEVSVGDFSTMRVPGRFSVVYLVYNTIMNVTTQEGQVAVFQNAAHHLETGGQFIIEVMIPDLRLLPSGQSSVVFRADETGWGIDEYDPASQGMISHHIAIADGDLRRFSVPFRYVWPGELDLMAQMAGMALTERWEDWEGSPFTSESRRHISVWKKT